MRVEHLLQWLHEATRDNTPDTTNWQKVVAIVKTAFRKETIAEESTCQTVILISKWESGEFREIELVEVLWKAFTSLLNLRLTADIKFHYVLHGF